MKTYFAYTRVSTQKQGEKGVSLQEQRDAILRYAQTNRLEISSWFEERETAAKGGRPVFSQMLKQLRKGKAQGLIIHKIDRSARNLKDWAEIGDLVDNGVELHSAFESLDLMSRGGRLSADIQAIIAADYIRNLREEVRKGIYGRLKQGIWPFGAPLGYLNQGKGKLKVFDPQRAPLVRKAFELYATGNYSHRSLYKELRDMGLTNSRGGRFSRNTLLNILNNPYYCGLLRLGSTGETFKGNHQPLISAALFEQCQAVRDGKRTGGVVKHDYLFRKFLTCSECGYKLIGERQKGRIYYRCHTRACPMTTVREDQIDERVAITLKSLEFTPEQVEQIRQELVRLDQHHGDENAKLLDTAKLNLQRLKQRSNRLTDAFIDGLVDKQTHDERREGLLLDIQKHEEHIAGLESGGIVFSKAARRFLELAESAHSSYISAASYDKRDLINELTSNCQASPIGLDIRLHEPFATFAKCRKLTECAQDWT